MPRIAKRDNFGVFWLASKQVTATVYVEMVILKEKLLGVKRFHILMFNKQRGYKTVPEREPSYGHGNGPMGEPFWLNLFFQCENAIC